MAFCQKNHRYNPRWNRLPVTQAYFGQPERWKCAGCAYEQGFKDGFNDQPNAVNLAALNQTETEPARHKNPIVAYGWGYVDGQAARA